MEEKKEERWTKLKNTGRSMLFRAAENFYTRLLFNSFSACTHHSYI